MGCMIVQSLDEIKLLSRRGLQARVPRICKFELNAVLPTSFAIYSSDVLIACSGPCLGGVCADEFLHACHRMERGHLADYNMC
jgi:hypothetical protein